MNNNKAIGNFVIQRELFRGGEGTIFLATALDSNEQVCSLGIAIVEFFVDAFRVRNAVRC